MDILVIVEGQRMKLASNQNHHIEGSNEFVKFKFDLSSEWTGLTVHAQFVQNGENFGGPINGNYTYLPNDIKEGECKLVLWGVDGTVRATTNYISLTIGKDISVLRALSKDISKTDYETAITQLGKYIQNGGVSEEALQAAFSKKIAELVNPDSIKSQVLSGITTAKQGIDEAKSAIDSAKTEISSTVATAKTQIDNAVKQAKQYSDSSARDAASADDTLKKVNNLKSDVDTALASANTAVTKAESALSTANEAVKAKAEIVGSSGTASKPLSGSALYEIREAKELILGKDGIIPQVRALKEETVSARDKSLEYKESAESAKAASEAAQTAAKKSEESVNSSKASIDQISKEIFGEGGSLSSPTTGALKEVRETKQEITNFNKSGGSLEQAKASAQTATEKANLAKTSETNAKASEIKAAASESNAQSSATAAKAVENKIDQANKSAAEIEEFYSDISTKHAETVTARNDILSEGTDGKSVYAKIIESDTNINRAKSQIIGSSGTASATDPDNDSALKKALDAAQRAEAAAENANHGIIVENNLTSVSTTNALSAAQGKTLNDNKLDKSGGTMTGDLILKGAPTSNNMAATKKYVDDNTPTVPQSDYNQNDETQPDYIKNRPCYEIIKAESKIEYHTTFANNVAEIQPTAVFEIGEKIIPELNGVKFSELTVTYGQPQSISISDTAGEISFTFYTNKTMINFRNYHRTSDSTLTLYKTQKVTRKKISKYNVETGNSVGEGYTWPVSGDAVKKYVDDHVPTISDASTSASGLMSSTDKTKLDGIDKGANNYTHPTSHSATMITEDETHRFVTDTEKTAWDSKVDKVSGKGLSTNDYTTEDQTKLAGIDNNANNYSLPTASQNVLGGIKIGENLSITEDGVLSADAQQVTVDAAVTENSTNPVSSGAVFEKLGNLKFVVSNQVPTINDPNIITLVL